MKGRIWLEGCGAGILFTLAYTWFHISPLHTDLYHRQLPMNVYWGITGDLAALCLFFALIFRLLRKYDREGSSLWWAFIAGVLAARLAAGLAVAGLIGYGVATPGRAFGIVCGALVLMWTVRRAWYQAAVKTARFSLLLAGICDLLDAA